MQIEPSSIVVFLIGGFSGGLLTYLKEKGKNRALLEDIKKIEGEKQDVSHKYAQKLEKLRRDHTIEIEQRKYQYEAKQTQYINFFAKLDEYTRDANQKIKGDVTSKFSSFMMNFVSAEMNNDKEKAALTVNEFMEFNQNTMNDINANKIWTPNVNGAVVSLRLCFV
ncbi:hypothetical protein [Shewanella algae]|uniref:hypothetical protein n=1 Tax=Shewanella algae TaxID=38313 RepID=UPI0031F5040F